MNLPPLSFIPTNVSDAIWYVYAIALFIFIVHTFLILYHWLKYAERGKVLHTFWTIYLAVASLIISAMTVSTLTLL